MADVAYLPLYRDREAYERTRGMTVAEASILLGCSDPTVRTMRRYFEQEPPKQEFKPEQEFDDTPWFDLIQTTAIAFDTDTSYAVDIAEDARALRNGWNLKNKSQDRCHYCANKATTLSGHCQKHYQLKNMI